MDSHELRWRVLNVITNHEKRVVEHLMVRSVEQYLPLFAERSKWSDRVVNLERPLFPGYVFVRFAPEQRISVISVPGVVHLLGDTERDTVSEAEIARIREGLASGCLLRPHRGIAVGMRARVLQGVFAGAEGIVTDLRQHCKIVMALSATGQSFSLEVDVEEIEVLAKSAAKDLGARRRDAALNGIQPITSMRW